MDRRIELVIAKIKTDPASAWDFVALAVLVNLSPSRFRHLFKQETGSSPGQYIKDYRMRKAESMLRTTFFSVKELLKQVGLGSNSHFVRDFRKKHGMTPTAFRKTFCQAATPKRSRPMKH